MSASKTKTRGLALALFAGALTAGPAAALAQPYGPPPAYGQPPPPAYGPPPDGQRYDEERARQEDQIRRDYDARYGPGAYDRYYEAQAAEADRRCREQRKGNQVGGALLGGIAGAVLGSNVARGGGRTGGAIIGGVGGAALGSTIAKGATQCEPDR